MLKIFGYYTVTAGFHDTFTADYCSWHMLQIENENGIWSLLSKPNFFSSESHL